MAMEFNTFVRVISEIFFYFLLSEKSFGIVREGEQQQQREKFKSEINRISDMKNFSVRAHKGTRTRFGGKSINFFLIWKFNDHVAVVMIWTRNARNNVQCQRQWLRNCFVVVNSLCQLLLSNSHNCSPSHVYENLHKILVCIVIFRSSGGKF